MAYKVEFLPDAAREFETLDGSLKKPRRNRSRKSPNDRNSASPSVTGWA